MHKPEFPAEARQQHQYQRLYHAKDRNMSIVAIVALGVVVAATRVIDWSML
jgi:hypothetical protein